MFATCLALYTLWPSWTLPLCGTSDRLATLGLNWGSRAGVWTIDSAVPVIGMPDGAGIQNLRCGGCRTWHHLNRARPDLPLDPDTCTPNVLRHKNFQSLITTLWLKALVQTKVAVPFLVWQLWDPNLIDRGERRGESSNMQVRCDADQDLEGEFMNQSFSCSDQSPADWLGILCFLSVIMTRSLPCTYLFLFPPFYLSSLFFFLWLWQICRMLSFYLLCKKGW